MTPLRITPLANSIRPLVLRRFLATRPAKITQPPERLRFSPTRREAGTLLMARGHSAVTVAGLTTPPSVQKHSSITRSEAAIQRSAILRVLILPQAVTISI